MSAQPKCDTENCNKKAVLKVNGAVLCISCAEKAANENNS